MSKAPKQTLLGLAKIMNVTRLQNNKNQSQI